MISPTIQLTNLSSQSMVWLFPSLGVWDASTHSWECRLSGTIFRPSVVKLPKRLQVRLLRKAMQVPVEAFESALFQERISPFMGAPHRGRRLTLEIDGRLYRIPRKSRRNGHFQANLRLEHVRSAGDRWIDVATWREAGPQSTLGGRIQLLSDTGTSVISDIDDTIKDSGVGCRRTLLANTFLREFSAIDGMADRYRHWSRQGIAFHYVSSSPWQLFAPLTQWREAIGLPEGSFHLRRFKLGDHMLSRLLRMRRQGKARVIRQLLQQFPRRRFVLIGDSTEHDPEIYGAVARESPAQVAAIYIRQLPHNPVDIARAGKAFQQLPGVPWKCFEHSDELPEHLLEN